MSRANALVAPSAAIDWIRPELDPIGPRSDSKRRLDLPAGLRGAAAKVNLKMRDDGASPQGNTNYTFKNS